MPQVTALGAQSQPTTYWGLRTQPRRLSPRSGQPFPASVQMLSGMVKMNHYQTAEIEAYEVRLRFVPGRFEAIVWRGAELSVDSIEDVGMRGRWLRILCSRRDKV